MKLSPTEKILLRQLLDRCDGATLFEIRTWSGEVVGEVVLYPAPKEKTDVP